jgi:N-formylglutamate deformylase
MASDDRRGWGVSATPWLATTRGDAPLLVSLPHTGLELADLEPRLISAWLARKDADWWIDQLYDFASDLGATVVRTSISRTVIDVNRDPSGVSLYPGQATTGLCPTTTFDGEPLYLAGGKPDASEIAERKSAYFDPYHRALAEEIARLQGLHGVVALYDCHSIRSAIPRLFDGELPEFNLGTNGGASADAALIGAVADLLCASGRSHVVDGRFKGGWITRSFGAPARGVHALQMELACRAYLRELVGPVTSTDWPSPYDPGFAAPTREALRAILVAVRDWARQQSRGQP